MPNSLSTILALITGIGVIILLFVLYLRSRQGDQRVITLINQMLLPLLGAVIAVIGLVYSNYQSSAASCSGILTILRYAGAAVPLALLLIGLLRYLLSQSRDRRLFIHPVLFAIMFAVAVFLVEYVSGCL